MKDAMSALARVVRNTTPLSQALKRATHLGYNNSNSFLVTASLTRTTQQLTCFLSTSTSFKITKPKRAPVPERNCDDIRRLLKYLTNSHQFNVKTLIEPKNLNVSYQSYLFFMRENGPNAGKRSNTYRAALPFFATRYRKGVNDEEDEIEYLEKKREKEEATRLKWEKHGRKGMFILSPDKHKKLSEITLEGEEDDNVPIFDDSDEIWRKIKTYLKQHNNDVDKLKAEMEARFHKRKLEISTWHLTRSRNTLYDSPAYYAAYVLFEKYRIAQGRRKSDHRMKNEWKWPKGGWNEEHPDKWKSILWWAEQREKSTADVRARARDASKENSL